MRKTNFFRISVNIDPAVRQFLFSLFPCDEGACNLTKSRYYFLVTQMLAHSRIAHPSRVPKVYDTFVPCTLLITEYDFYHYGWMVPPLQQYNFSRLLLSDIMEDLCMKTALLTLSLGVPQSNAMQAVLEEKSFSSISFDRLRKYYYRKFRQKEAEIDSLIKKIYGQKRTNLKKTMKNGRSA